MPAEPSQLAEIRQLCQHLAVDRWYDIGFPGARDLHYPELADLLTGHLLNNIGDPYDDGHGRAHTKEWERQVVDILGDWLGAPLGRWGYVTAGSSEGTYHALDEAWQAFHGNVTVYCSVEAHYSVQKGARLFRLPLVVIGTDSAGRMNTDDLEDVLARRREHPAMIVATAGTTMTEAVDDVAAIVKVCERLSITRRRIHVDAALSGVPLALLPASLKPPFDFTAGATSIVISGHKFLSTLQPCGVLIYADNPHLPAGRRVAYTGSADTTLGGSRSGHTPLLLWWTLTTLGKEGHRTRATQARHLALYTHQRLTDIGWEASLNPQAFTVVLASPPEQVRKKWILADDGRRAHIVCLPGIETAQIDEFLRDLEASRDVAKDQAPVHAAVDCTDTAGAGRVPRQRSRAVSLIPFFTGDRR